MGFKGANKREHRERSSKGGTAAHEAGTARRWSPEEAREAGRKAAAERKRAPILPPGTRSG
jgi:hypothetical protein